MSLLNPWVPRGQQHVRFERPNPLSKSGTSASRNLWQLEKRVRAIPEFPRFNPEGYPKVFLGERGYSSGHLAYLAPPKDSNILCSPGPENHEMDFTIASYVSVTGELSLFARDWKISRIYKYRSCPPDVLAMARAMADRNNVAITVNRCSVLSQFSTFIFHRIWRSIV